MTCETRENEPLKHVLSLCSFVHAVSLASHNKYHYHHCQTWQYTQTGNSAKFFVQSQDSIKHLDLTCCP